MPSFSISLTYAYISANGAIISETISMNLGYHANPRIVGICTAIFVASVLWLSSLAASRITSLFLGLKIISFVIVFWFFFLPCRLLHSARRHQLHCGNVLLPRISLWLLPVCLASFGFHGNIPSLIICYGKRKDKLIKSVVFGSAAGAGDLSLLALLHHGEYSARKLLRRLSPQAATLIRW
ncbi:aromatic amino acid transport family protein [Escherichia coli]